MQDLGSSAAGVPGQMRRRYRFTCTMYRRRHSHDPRIECERNPCLREPSRDTCVLQLDGTQPHRQRSGGILHADTRAQARRSPGRGCSIQGTVWIGHKEIRRCTCRWGNRHPDPMLSVFPRMAIGHSEGDSAMFHHQEGRALHYRGSWRSYCPLRQKPPQQGECKRDEVTSGPPDKMLDA